MFCSISLAPLLMPFFTAMNSWPGYRGLGGDGHSYAKNIPTQFGEKENLRWKTAIHDKGWSSPVVWGNQVWVTTAKESGEEMFSLCLDLKTGKILHDLKLFKVKNPPKIQQYNSFASCTPVLEAGRGYFHFGTHGTACVDTGTGKVLWERTDILVDHWRGPASSPVLWDGKLFLTFDGHDRQFVEAIDAQSNKTLWRKERNIKYKVNDGDYKKAFSTPQIIDVNGSIQLVSSAADSTLAYNPSTGQELWKVFHGGMNEAGRPIYAHGLVYLTAGHIKALIAVKPGQGDLTAKDIAWEFKKDAPTRPSPIVVGDHLYFANDDGVAYCLDAKTGKEVWKERLAEKITASPILVEGNLIFCCEGGKIEIVAAKPKFERILEKPNAIQDGIKGSPAAVGDSLLIRTSGFLYCFAR